jgi:hypothetical protein
LCRDWGIRMWHRKFKDDTFKKYHPVTFVVGWAFVAAGVYTYIVFGPNWPVGILAAFLTIWGVLIVRNQLTLKRQAKASPTISDRK